MNKTLRMSVLISLSLMGWYGRTAAQETAGIDRDSFYQAMSADKAARVDAEIKQVQQQSFPGKDAFEGALTMKKAGLGGTPPKKLKLFKAGHKQLEAAIKSNPDNGEYRFLRIMIQEHAPGILGYNNDLTKDRDLVIKHYKNLPRETQQAITDYAKKSKTLKPADF